MTALATAEADSYFTLSMVVPSGAAEYFTVALEGACDSIANFELKEDSVLKVVELAFTSPPDVAEITSCVLRLASFLEIPAPTLKKSTVRHRDWVEEVARAFTPIRAGGFFVHSSYYKNEGAEGAIPIHIDPGMAFGTGQHESTHLCLEALEGLKAEGREFGSVLDMGAGSGILAIAALKLWEGAEALAVDIDQVAVRVAEENARQNRVEMGVAVSDGYSNPKIAAKAPFGLITSNILANPICEFAPRLSENLAEGGFAILSGFTLEQADRVAAAHKLCGLYEHKRLVRNNWVGMVVGK